MNKTFKRVIAFVLTVLMVTCSMPFTALAGPWNCYDSDVKANRKWWIDDGITPQQITQEPEFWGYNSPQDDVHQPMGPWDFQFGDKLHFSNDDEYETGQVNPNGYEDHRNDYKPFFAVTVSDVGTKGEDIATLAKKFNQNYAANKNRTFDAAMADGTIINPAKLKAGQRIAVTFEMGGFDIINNSQILAYVDETLVKTGYYSGTPSARGGDRWVTTYGASPWKDGNALYAAQGAAVVYAGAQSTDERVAIAVMAQCVVNGEMYNSNYIGRNAQERGFDSPYGLVMGTCFFEVQKDCDLKDAVKMSERPDGCIIEPIARDMIGGNAGLYNGSIGDYKGSFVNMPVVYTAYQAEETPAPCTHTNTTETKTVTTVATCETAGVETVTVTCNDCGEVVSTTTNPIAATGHNYTGAVVASTTTQHTVACVNGCGTVQTVDCTFVETGRKDATVKEAGYINYGCTACTNGYTTVLDKLVCTHANTTTSEEVTKAATCTEEGTKVVTVTCNDCGEVANTTTEAIAMIAHTEKTVAGKAATCTATGLTDGKVCEVCGTELVAQEVIPMVAHTEKTVAGKAATCTATGLTDGKVCEVCGTVIVAQEVIPMVAHTEKTVAGKAATCTETGLTDGTVCAVCDKVLVAQEVIEMIAHNYVVVDGTAVAPTIDAQGKEADQKCTACGNVITGAAIAMLPSAKITVTAAENGTVTLNGVDATQGTTVKFAPKTAVTLTAVPNEGAKFVGWIANGATTVSTKETLTTYAIADVTYTPVFEKVEAESFTVTFIDAYNNIISAQTVTDASQIVKPEAPERSGYNFIGWSVSDEAMANITKSTTIIALYELAKVEGFTVTANGATITVAGNKVNDVATDVAYDTLVTVSMDGASAWAINGVTVAYGNSYSFYVGQNIEVVAVKEAVKAVPVVANVGTNEVGATGKIKAQFIATRTIVDGYTYIDSGFVYGKGDLGEISLENVDGKAVKAIYTKTASEQFSLSYGLAAQAGTMTARAFIAYADVNGEVTVVYAAPTSYTYK